MSSSGRISAQAPTGRHHTGARSGVRRPLTSRQRLTTWAFALLAAIVVTEWHLVWAAVSGMETMLFIALSLGLLDAFLTQTEAVRRGAPNTFVVGDMPFMSYQISPQANWAFHTYSTIDSPPIISLVSLPNHEQVRVLEANETLRDNVAELNQSPTEFFQVEIDDGVPLDGWCMKPPDFDPTKQYPLLFYLYGEPANVTVVDRWVNQRHLYHRLWPDPDLVRAVPRDGPSGHLPGLGRRGHLGL